jgi:hypothetical protein
MGFQSATSARRLNEQKIMRVPLIVAAVEAIGLSMPGTRQQDDL